MVFVWWNSCPPWVIMVYILFLHLYMLHWYIVRNCILRYSEALYDYQQKTNENSLSHVFSKPHAFLITSFVPLFVAIGCAVIFFYKYKIQNRTTV